MAGVGLAEENKVPKEPDRSAEGPGEAASQAPARAEGPKSIGSYFSWRPLPWWVCFLLGIFLLTKFQIVYNDSPCAVLGLQGPVTAADLKKAFRHLSMCTHPDRLRGRLKRTPTQEESRRGEIIFNRASTAREDLLKTQRGKQPMQCYQGELELAVLLFFQQVGRLFASLGLEDYLGFFWESVWAIITFEAGIINTLLALLWLSFVYKLLRQFGGYLWRMGILRFVLGFITTVVIGPIPTVVNFFFLPFIRIFVFLDSLRGQDRQEEQQSKKTDDPPVSGEEKKTEPQQPSTANIKLESDKDRNHLRQRKKKDNSEDKDTRNKELVNEEVNATDDSSGAPVTANGQLKPKPMPEGLWKIVTWSHKEQVKARQAAANAMQFDLLLILTKPVIPLIMLVATGQVWNGILSSMFIGHALRKWVPQMSYEAQHLFCALFGVLHTMLGVSASKLEDYANREGSKMLHLAWAWSLKDVLSVMHMCQLGAAVTALSALGNEPSYAASFASGIALRIAVGQDAFRGLGFAHTVADYFQATVRDLGVSMDAAEEVVAYSGGGIGDCGGGPFRMLFGDETWAAAAAGILKVWLLLLPALSTAQWLQRTIHAGRMLGKRYKLTRVIQRLILCLLGVLQICLFAMSELNASNGALINYWLAMLFGCAGESLLSTFDIRGPVRQIVFLLLFVMV